MAYRHTMIRIATFLIVLCSFAGRMAWAIECMDKPGDPKSGWYAWREIDGRKCWFKKTGGMPAKSELHWPAKVEREPPQREPPPAQASPAPQKTIAIVARPPEQTQPAIPPPNAAPVSHVTTLQVKPAAAGSLRVDNGQIDLMSGASLSGAEPFGSGRQSAPRLSPADPFGARFTGKP
jgi:hypothetical protein